jgi:hypothetical protein
MVARRQFSEMNIMVKQSERNIMVKQIATTMLFLLILLGAVSALSSCDTMEGPVKIFNTAGKRSKTAPTAINNRV